MKKMLFAAIMLISCYGNLSAQDSPYTSPISAEVVGGHNRLNFQLFLNRQVGQSRFSVFNLSNFSTDYQNTPSALEYNSLGLLHLRIFKGLGISAGGAVNSQTGFRPFAGLQFFMAKKAFLIALVSGIYLTETNNLESLALIEFKPKLVKKLGLYSRAQLLYNHNVYLNEHNNSYLNLRLGLSFKLFAFGAAANFSQYGSDMNFQDNYGGFVRVEF